MAHTLQGDRGMPIGKLADVARCLLAQRKNHKAVGTSAGRRIFQGICYRIGGGTREEFPQN